MIDSIYIKNYKSIRHLELELSPINIFIGANGAGKSNFISFFKLLKNMYDQNLQLYVTKEGGANDLLYFGLKHSEQIVGSVSFDKAHEYSFILKPSNDDHLFFEKENINFSQLRYSENVGVGQKESKLKEHYSELSFCLNEYMDSFRVFHFHDTSSTSKMRQSSIINDNSFLREDGGNLSAYLYWMQEKHPKDFKKIEMCIRSVAPYFDRFDLKPDRLNEQIIRLEWKEKGSDAYFSAKHLSDGTLRFIALVTLLLQSELPQVIIIDEPELGLHPFAINKLAALVKKASEKSQIIISTQSINFVDNFAPEDIITVDREDHQSVFQRQNSEALQLWLQDYSISDLWNKNVIGGRP